MSNALSEEELQIKFKNAVRERINELCEKHEFNQSKLVRKSGVKQSTLSEIQKSSMPSMYNLFKISKAFDISLTTFFDTEAFRSFEEEYKQYLKEKRKQSVKGDSLEEILGHSNYFKIKG